MALGTATKQGAGGGGGSSTITTFLGSTTSGPVNITQYGSVATSLGQKLMASSIPVTLASDQSSIPVAATLSAETTKVIGVVRTADGSGNLLTTNSTTYTAKFALDANLLGTLGTAFSTAGKVDVKGADGDVFVRQTTGSNLHMVVDSGTITTVSTVTAVTSLTNALPAGTNNIGLVTPTPSSNTGWLFKYVAGGLTATKVQLKGTAGTFGGWAWLYNPNTAATYIQVFNKASASVSVGVTTPDFVIVLPGIATASATGSAANAEISLGIAMGTGITVAATTTETGSSAPANNIFVTFLYI